MSDDGKPLAVSMLTKCEEVAECRIVTKAAASKGGELAARPLKWKRDIVSPQISAESPLAPSEPGTSSKDQSHSPKLRKKNITREDSRKANDLMHCFRTRAATTAEIAGEDKDKPVASASTD